MVDTAHAISPNFSFLPKREALLAQLGTLAERYFADDPNGCLVKLRQFGEVAAQSAAAHAGVYLNAEEAQVDLLRRLKQRGVLTDPIADIFHGLRRTGNAAIHEMIGSQREALHQLKMAHQLALWYWRAFYQVGAVKPEPFAPPSTPRNAGETLTLELAELRDQLEQVRARAEAAELTAEEQRRRRESAEFRAVQRAEDTVLWQQLAEEQERQRAALAAQLETLQAEAVARPAAETQQVVQVACQAAEQLDLDERDTRHLIDQQLRDAGWLVDSQELRYGKGARPAKGQNLAIAEWPTTKGPADYALFIGLKLYAIVEAKRARRKVPAALEQSKRYARAVVVKGDEELVGGPWGDYKVPFLFATNGRPFFRQLVDESGIWFIDVRRPQNLARPLDGWYTPEGLKAELTKDVDQAHEALKAEGTEYLGLRPYQLLAIDKVEGALDQGQRECLVAMATGTGKTRTCIGLVYRLLKTRRLRRILFLVDRTALGEQAGNAFKDTRLEGLQTFAQIFDMKELADLEPEPDTKLHIATVQSMVRRVLIAQECGETPPPVDQYDAIVVDECHRGYLLDKEMGEVEMEYRDEADYISSYRRVLDHFDAIKIGLTATPALHTTEIFGAPVYEYSYREAVIDGFLVDHEPPIRIVTKLGEDGITWRAGEEVATYLPETGQLDLIKLPDEVKVELEEFNTRVLTESFNQVVCEVLARRVDPSLDEKTIIYCARDTHCDTVVRLLKAAFAKQYGEVEDDAVVKITGQADKPLQLIRRFKNERLPSVAVTVDLLTTGIDVPPVANLVFLRRVGSRILYEQMLGRATRLCPDIGKETFRIFDAVDIYTALARYTNMKPVVVNPHYTFEELWQELAEVDSARARSSVTEQIVAKLQRKRRKIEESAEALEAFVTIAGEDPTAVLQRLAQRSEGRQLLSPGAAEWLLERPTLAALLDRKFGGGRGVLISDHEDELRRIERGYGSAAKPEDYIEGFAKYLREHMNDIPALLIVTQRPRELTREQLKEIKLALDQAGYNERGLQTAWRETTNQDIAASIIGFIRQKALGEPLLSYDERVERALRRIIQGTAWTAPQRKWLERIGKQMVKETVVDRAALDRGEFKTQGGGFQRMNKVFDGKLEQVLSDLHDELWKVAG